jgi:membrane-associated PAP2 superfamily phosphatase
MPTDTARRRGGFWRSHVVVPALCFVAGLVIIYLGGLDFKVADAFYDAARERFPWRHAHLTQAVLHDGGDRLIMVCACAALLLWVASFLRPGLRRFRLAAAHVVLGIGLTVATVAVAKAYSNVDCPWSVSRYGGDRPYVHLFSRRPPELPDAACFPGAHSAGAFSLFSTYFAARALGFRAAAWLLPPVGALGTVYAATQWARGAHFVSHDVWSAALAWTICLLVHLALTRGRRRSPSSAR